MRKRILIATAVFPPEPVVSANLLMDLAVELSKDFDVTVIKPKPTRPFGFKQSQFEDHNQYEIVTVSDSYVCPQSSLIGRLRESISFGIKVAEYIDWNKDKIDLIYNAVWPLYGKNIVAKAAIRNNIRYLTNVQDIYPESILSKLPNWKICQWIINGLFLNIDKYTQRNAVAIHTISDGMADYLSESRKIDRSKYHVVRNWQDEETFISYRNENHKRERVDSPFTFMYMGNIGPLAGLETVIKAFDFANLDARLVIAGSGSAKTHLMELAKDNTKIEFWDVPAGQVPATQDKADVMVLAIKKGFASSSIPSKLPAYMFSAKPVLCSVDSDSDTAKCVVDAHGGWTVEAENPEALAAKMKVCMETPSEKLEEMGNSNLDYAIKNFSKKEGVKKLARMFSNFLIN